MVGSNEPVGRHQMVVDSVYEVKCDFSHVSARRLFQQSSKGQCFHLTLPVLLVVLRRNVFGKPVDFALHVSRYLVPLALPWGVAVGVQSLFNKGYAWVLHVLNVIFGAFGIVLCFFLCFYCFFIVSLLFFIFLFLVWIGTVVRVVCGPGCPAVWTNNIRGGVK